MFRLASHWDTEARAWSLRLESTWLSGCRWLPGRTAGLEGEHANERGKPTLLGERALLSLDYIIWGLGRTNCSFKITNQFASPSWDPNQSKIFQGCVFLIQSDPFPRLGSTHRGHHVSSYCTCLIVERLTPVSSRHRPIPTLIPQARFRVTKTTPELSLGGSDTIGER